MLFLCCAGGTSADVVTVWNSWGVWDAKNVATAVAVSELVRAAKLFWAKVVTDGAVDIGQNCVENGLLTEIDGNGNVLKDEIVTGAVEVACLRSTCVADVVENGAEAYEAGTLCAVAVDTPGARCVAIRAADVTDVDGVCAGVVTRGAANVGTNCIGKGL